MTIGLNDITGWRLRVVQALCIGLVALKFAHLALAGVFMDEAYYWMWGQHPALSYYDHPPLNAWLLSLSSGVFGWNVFALRLPVALTFLADILALWLLAGRIGGNERMPQFWVTLLLFLATPVFSMVTNYALPDHALLTACLFSIYFFYRFFSDRASGHEGATRDLMLGALFLGLGGLAKYNAAFLGLGVAAFVFLRDPALLRQLRLYAAAALTLALQLPVVIWNASERFASWDFILSGRHQGLAASVDGLLPLGLGLLIFVSPFMFWPMARFVLSNRMALPGSGFARASFGISTVAIFGLALTTATIFHWNLVAYAAALPFLAYFMRPRWLLGLQALFGVGMAVALFINYAITPITDVRGWRDEATAWSYGWTDIVAATEAARVEHNAAFVAATDYTTASLLGFHMGDRNVVSLAARQDQFDYWFDAAANAGEDAILYVDRYRPLTRRVEAMFESVTPIARQEVEPNGHDVNTHEIYLARGFRPDR